MHAAQNSTPCITLSKSSSKSGGRQSWLIMFGRWRRFQASLARSDGGVTLVLAKLLFNRWRKNRLISSEVARDTSLSDLLLPLLVMVYRTI